MYCTYLTTYSGNKLPPFYIGYTKVSKIASGYRGSVKSLMYKKIWEEELKNNFKAFNIKILSYHSTKEEAKEKEEFLQTKLNVVKNSMYINRSIQNKKFSGNEAKRTYYTNGIENKLIFEGKQIPEGYYKGFVGTNGGFGKGSNNINYGGINNVDAKNKMSQAKKGKKSFFFGKNHTNETKNVLSIACKGKKWFNNGTTSIMSHYPPSQEWVSGRIYLRKNKA